MEQTEVINRTEQVLSPWVTLVTHGVRLAGTPGIQQFHSFKQADYVTMLAVTTDEKIPLVRQYRPALERFTWELPSGMLDAGENPEQAAVRELLEETGFVAARVDSLGCMAPDSARLENRLWAFFTRGARLEKPNAAPLEPQLECRLVSKDELKKLVFDGQLDHGLHVAVIGQALIRGLFSFH